MKYICKLGAVALMASSIVACSDKFLEEKKVYGKFDEKNMYSTYDGATDRVNTLYRMMMPLSCKGDGNGTSGVNDYTSTGYADKWAKSTLEYGGFSEWVKPDQTLDYENVTDYFYVINDIYSPWGNIRNANDIIAHVENNTQLNDDERNKVLGQAYFFRAFRYWTLVKIYGGVPLILEVQDPIVGDSDGSDKVVQRSTTKACVEQICADLDKAAGLLPDNWTDNADFGRVTSGAALALKGRVLLFYASPLFNRQNDAARWTDAYNANKAAVAKLNASGYNLAYAGAPGTNASNWAKIFLNNEGSDGTNKEAILVTLFNSVDKTSAGNYDKWSGWEQSIRPVNNFGNGSLHPTAEMVDLFPMADGTRPGTSYSSDKFWFNRDPRFYRTFAFPGVKWAFDSNGNDLNSKDDKGKYVYNWYAHNNYSSNGNDYALWSYTWYKKDADVTSVSSTSNGYTADLLATKNSAIYIRKRSDDTGINSTPLYKYSTNSSIKGFSQNAAPQMLMRYTEVLLNLAEAAAGSGNCSEAYGYLIDIRKRAGVLPGTGGTYGLATAVASDKQTCLNAVLYERMIELAYEGKSFDDCRRWMLFDGGVGQESIKPSWKLVNWGASTCSYLGAPFNTPLNGRRRHEIVLYNSDGNTYEEGDANDPLAAFRSAPLDLTEDMTDKVTAGRVKDLDTFYGKLKRKNCNVDGNDATMTITFRPEYYFIGLKKSAMQTNPLLEQNVGWHDLGRNIDGTFDPLAE